MTWNSATSGVFGFVLFSESTSVCHHAQIMPVTRRSITLPHHPPGWLDQGMGIGLFEFNKIQWVLRKTLKTLDSILLMCNKKVVSAENDSCYFGVKEESFCENGQNTKEAKPSNEESNHALDTVSGMAILTDLCLDDLANKSCESQIFRGIIFLICWLFWWPLCESSIKQIMSLYKMFFMTYYWPSNFS